MNLVRPLPAPASGLLSEDDVLPDLAGWICSDKKAALVTLMAIEGGSPRPIGAQMAVNADGAYTGYLSGGCLEQAIALEAQAVIESGTNRLVRYGRGSPYFDVQLPCGSGLDVYFDAGVTPQLLREGVEHLNRRRPFALITDLASGQTRIARQDVQWTAGNHLADGVFTRLYLPQPRMLLLGAGPSVPALCRMAMAAGIETTVWAGDDVTRAKLDALGVAHFVSHSAPLDAISELDPYTAVVLAFHEHAQEPAILDHVLASECFYIGVLGNHAVHRQRLARLKELGHTPESLARLRGPIGIISQAKSQATLAVGIVSEVLIEAKLRNLVA